jgi:hypothetical protein
MPSQQTIHDLVAQIGPVIDLAQVTAFPDDAAWRMVFDATTWIDMEYDDAAARLVFTGTVGPVDEGARPRTYEALLRYAYLWTEHGGVRAALDGTPGNVVLMFEMPATDVDLPRLCQVLQNLRTVIDGWREVLPAIASGSATPGQEIIPMNMIRV